MINPNCKPVRSLSVCAALLLLSVPVLAHGWVPPEPPVQAPPPTRSVPRQVAPTGPLRQGEATPGAVGRTTPAPLPKATISPWLTRIHVPWQAVFLPVDTGGNYAVRPVSVSEALQRTPEEGGWTKNLRPSVVLTYDPSRPDHLKIVRSMDQDTRIRAVSHLFNCLRLDVRSSGKSGPMERVTVYLTDGTQVGEVKTDRKLTKVYRLLEKGWQKTSGSGFKKILPRLQRTLGEIARTEWEIARLQPDLVSSRSGRVRDHVARMMTEMHRLQATWRKALRRLRSGSSD